MSNDTDDETLPLVGAKSEYYPGGLDMLGLSITFGFGISGALSNWYEKEAESTTSLIIIFVCYGIFFILWLYWSFAIVYYAATVTKTSTTVPCGMGCFSISLKIGSYFLSDPSQYISVVRARYRKAKATRGSIVYTLIGITGWAVRTSFKPTMIIIVGVEIVFALFDFFDTKNCGCSRNSNEETTTQVFFEEFKKGV